MNTPTHMPPPAGYLGWLDYAVETFDTRALMIEGLFADELVLLDRDAMREAARAELRQLRQAADSRGGAGDD